MCTQGPNIRFNTKVVREMETAGESSLWECFGVLDKELLGGTLPVHNLVSFKQNCIISK